MKKAVVTGANGFIGKALTKKLLENGWMVYAVVRDKGSLDGMEGSFQPVACDFAHYGRLAEQIGDDVDCFLHFSWAGVSAALSGSVMTQAENIMAAAEAMEQARRLGSKRFLFAGSSYQYRMEPFGGSYLPKNLYGAAKAAAERLLWASALTDSMAFNTVLFTNVFGVGDRSNRSTNVILRNLLAREPLRLISGEHLHDWTYIDDAVGGVMAVLEKGEPGKEYYVGSRTPVPFRDIVTRVRDLVSPETELFFGAYEDDAYIDYTKIDLDALYRDTGFECTADFDESIRRTSFWLSGESAGGVSPSIYLILNIVPALLAFCKGGTAWR